MGALTIEKGESKPLTIDKGDADFKVTLGCGWSVRQGVGEPYDLDVFLLLLDDNSRAIDHEGVGPVPYGIMFYNTPGIKDEATGVLTARDGSIIHHGDNLTGEGEGDDEVIEIWPNKVDPSIKKILISVAIFHGKQKGQTFGMVDNCYAHVDVPGDNDYKVLMGESDDLSSSHTVILGQLYRDPEDASGKSWKYRAVKQGFEDELIDVAKAHGIPF